MERGGLFETRNQGRVIGLFVFLRSLWGCQVFLSYLLYTRLVVEMVVWVE